MSVINQMLKDLEHRTPEQKQMSVSAQPVQKKSMLKVVIICTLVLISLNVVGLYIWSLQGRITKNNLQQQQANFKHAVHDLTRHQSITEKETTHQDIVSDNVAPVVQLKTVEQTLLVTTSEPELSPEIIIADSKLTSVQLAPEKNKSIEPALTAPKKIEKKSPSTISISRRELTPQELITQKLIRAEKQINANEVLKAEKLFEEVLIIDSTYTEARKKLAALWFGRQSYQDAVNLLSQGIALDKQDSELRLMKARVHLTQGQYEAAYNTLKPLKSIKQEEYQLMLANIAQKIQKYSSAINAYQVLIEIQPHSGRWHLGLATVYDKSSQFSLAINEYALALTKADLSVSSANFAQQRMQALGE